MQFPIVIPDLKIVVTCPLTYLWSQNLSFELFATTDFETRQIIFQTGLLGVDHLSKEIRKRWLSWQSLSIWSSKRHHGHHVRARLRGDREHGHVTV